VARSVRLSTDEAWAVLEGAHTGILTTLRRDGMPIALPVWFAVLDRRVYVSGPATTRKFARLRHDARVSFLVESGLAWAELVAVQLNGTAGVLTDAAVLTRAQAALDAKYAAFRTERSAMPEATRARYGVETATIEIVPDARILSWDNSRLFAPDPS
jgi:nitroimidazol reductase NimA-like FMN-containing flavoprotein (pyridoxamine 5'-phosphate oxidase superfamily)